VLGESAVRPQALQPETLRSRFVSAPSWEPEFRSDGFSFTGEVRDAAVLIPLVLQANALTMLLTKRSETLGSHAGQIAFPGGRVDPEDASPIAAALREAQEEVGMPIEAAEVLGTLPLYTTGTGFRITPVVALIDPQWPLQLSEHEVDEAFEVPLSFLMDPQHHRRVRVQLQERERMFYSMPYHANQREYFIWGATAAMLRNLYHFLRA
jgi:8-oxo-dGTP pyrophosphatase MutT (NUDIX family)